MTDQQFAAYLLAKEAIRRAALGAKLQDQVARQLGHK